VSGERPEGRSSGADGGDAGEGSTIRSGFGTETQYRTARDVLTRVERDGRLEAVRQRLGRVTVAALGAALVALNLSPGGLSGLVLSLWGYVGLGLGLLGGLVWLATGRFRDGDLERPDDGGNGNGNTGVTVDLGTVGAPLLALLADGTGRSTGLRLLWSLLLGEGSLPAADAVAAGPGVDKTDVARLRRSLTRAAWLSVGLVAVDLFVRYGPVDAVVALLAGGAVREPTLPSMPTLAPLGGLSTVEWVLVLVAVAVGGGLVGLVLAVTRKR
jgi:hypothetical protein